MPRSFPEFNSLRKIKDSSAGKNQTSIAGIYEKDGKKYYIKLPKDDKELFTEYFAGQLIKQLFLNELLCKSCSGIFCLTDLIDVEVEDAQGNRRLQPALIQDFQEGFVPLHEELNTSASDGADCSIIYENFWGKEIFEKFPDILEPRYRLASILMGSLLIGDYSVLRSNVGYIQGTSAKGLVRVNFDAAFRHIGQMPAEIMLATEVEGADNYQRVTRNFASYYKLHERLERIKKNEQIKGVEAKIAEKASELKKKDNFIIKLKSAVTAAFQTVATKMQSFASSNDEQWSSKFDFQQLAEEMSITELASISWDNAEPFINQLTEILLNRVEALSNLVPENQILEQSDKRLIGLNGSEFSPAAASSSDSTPVQASYRVKRHLFYDKVDELEKSLQHYDGKRISKEYIDDLYNSFLKMKSTLIQSAKDAKFWIHDGGRNENILAATFRQNQNKAYKFGVAFLPHLQESVILENLYISKVMNGSDRFQPFDDALSSYIAAEGQFNNWVYLNECLTHALSLCDALKNLEKINDDEEYIERVNIVKSLISSCKEYDDIFDIIDGVKRRNSSDILPQATDGENFYPISDEELQLLSPEQLTTIVLLELKAGQPGSQLFKIFSDDVLFKKFKTHFLEDINSDSSQIRNNGLFSGLVDSLAKDIKRWKSVKSKIIKNSNLTSDAIVKSINNFLANNSYSFELMGKSGALIQFFIKVYLENRKQYIDSFQQEIQQWLSTEMNESNGAVGASSSSDKKIIDYRYLQQRFSALHDWEQDDVSILFTKARLINNVNEAFSALAEISEFDQSLQAKIQELNTAMHALNDGHFAAHEKQPLETNASGLLNDITKKLAEDVKSLRTIGEAGSRIKLVLENELLFKERLDFYADCKACNGALETCFDENENQLAVDFEQLKQCSKLLSLLPAHSDLASFQFLEQNLKANPWLKHGFLQYAKSENYVSPVTEEQALLFNYICEQFDVRFKKYIVDVNYQNRCAKEFQSLCFQILKGELNSKKDIKGQWQGIQTRFDKTTISIFCRDKLKIYGRDDALHTAIQAFEDRAHQILEEDMSAKQQCRALRRLASEKFGCSKCERHLRILADVLLMLTGLGIFYHAYRYYGQGKTWFLSMEKDQLEEKASNLIKYEEKKKSVSTKDLGIFSGKGQEIEDPCEQREPVEEKYPDEHRSGALFFPEIN